MIDGREGFTCPDCGAYLQAIRYGGGDMFRCPWAHPSRWKLWTYVVNTQIYCDRPLNSARHNVSPNLAANP